jgi:hypothetical protein
MFMVFAFPVFPVFSGITEISEASARQPSVVSKDIAGIASLSLAAPIPCARTAVSKSKQNRAPTKHKPDASDHPTSHPSAAYPARQG